MKKSNEEKTYATLKLGKTYKFAGYNWMACEVDNDCHVVVIQSHGVTHGAWPGYTMPQFGNGNYYSNSINGKDISDYDDKMRALYDDIKDAEDKAAPYGEGLYTVGKCNALKLYCTDLFKDALLLMAKKPLDGDCHEFIFLVPAMESKEVYDEIEKEISEKIWDVPKEVVDKRR